MIERRFIEEKVKENRIKKFIEREVARCGYSNSELQRTPLGMKIIIWSSKPGLVVSKQGKKIKGIQKKLEKKFKLENLQMEIREIENPDLDPQIIAERVANLIERLETNRFKAIGHRNLQKIMLAGAKGAEIVISGKVPSARARSWRFKAGYLPKCGDITKKVLTGFKIASPKSGIVGVKVSILPSDVRMPDEVVIKEEKAEVREEKEKEEKVEEKSEKKGS